MSRKKRSRRIERLLFFIPVVVVILLVFFGLASNVSNRTATLVIEAVSSDRYSPSVALRVPVTVDSFQGTTPVNLSLITGQHTVVYGEVAWYVTPSPRTIQVSNGQTQYAVASYLPIVRAISVTSNGFNTTSVTALHGVTPVVWMNEGSSAAVLKIDSVGRIVINPSQNFTFVFGSTGTFGFIIFNTQYAGVVHSS